MKDSEFIELLNLYLDHEISATDAARLEAEVQRHPERRKVYQTYCRMQKACKMLTADFQTEEAGAAVVAEKKVIAFNPAAAAIAAEQRKRARGFYAVGSLVAAAACVAFVVVKQNRLTVEPAKDTIVQTTPVPVVSESRNVAVVAAEQTPSPRGGIRSVAGARHQNQPTLVADPLLLSNSPANNLRPAAMQGADNQLAWIQTLQIAPLQLRTSAEVLRFDTRPATLQPEPRTLGGTRPQSEADAELVAWRLTK